MSLHKLLFTLVVMIGAVDFTEAARSCSSITVPACSIRAPRDLLFLVDASDSLDPSRFQGEILDYTQSLFCAFNPLDVNRAGMISFASDVSVRIPLQVYTQTEWFKEVDEVRALNLCCSCCTPTASAFSLAKQVFDSVPANNALRSVLLITDGSPWQNKIDLFSLSKVSPAVYMGRTVPNQAKLLKDSGVRLTMIGVPNKFGEPPREDYFRGIPNPMMKPSGKSANWQCLRRNGKRSCFKMSSPPFPIVSLPLSENIVSSNSFNVQSLVALTLGSLCGVPSG